MSENQDSQDSKWAAFLGPVLFVNTFFGLVREPLDGVASLLGKQWANHVTHGGIPRTTRILMDAVDTVLPEVAIQELAELRETIFRPDYTGKDEYNNNMAKTAMQGVVSEILPIYAKDTALTALLVKDPGAGITLSAVLTAMDTARLRSEFYRNFVDIAGGIDFRTFKPNIPGFASVPFMDVKDQKKYTILIDAGHTFGDYIDGNEENKIVYFLIDEEGNPPSKDVQKRLEDNRVFQEEVLKTALEDAYSYLKNLNGVNMVDGKFDEEEYEAYIKNQLKESDHLKKMAQHIVRDYFKIVAPELYKNQISRNLNDYGIPEIPEDDGVPPSKSLKGL